MLLPKRSRYPGLPRRDWDMESRFLQYRSPMGIEDFINRSSIVALRNAKVVERRLNTLYSWRDSFDIRSSSKEIWGIARDSIPEISQKNFYWWDPNDREVRVKAIDLIINKVMKYGEG